MTRTKGKRNAKRPSERDKAIMKAKVNIRYSNFIRAMIILLEMINNLKQFSYLIHLFLIEYTENDN